jgi:hypothetical protein
MVSAWQTNTKDTLPADTTYVFCSSGATVSSMTRRRRQHEDGAHEHDHSMVCRLPHVDTLLWFDSDHDHPTVYELPLLDALLWLDGDDEGSKAHGLDLGMMGLDLGSVIFIFLKIDFSCQLI